MHSNNIVGLGPPRTSVPTDSYYKLSVFYYIFLVPQFSFCLNLYNKKALSALNKGGGSFIRRAASDIYLHMLKGRDYLVSSALTRAISVFCLLLSLLSKLL